MAVWDTRALPDSEQFEFYQQVICRAFVPLLPVAEVRGGGFASTVETLSLGTLNRASVASQQQATHHGPREVSATDRPYYFVNLQLRGRCSVRQSGTESVVSPGQFTVLDTARPFYLDFDRDWSMLSFRLPHELLDGRLPGDRLPLGAAMDGAGAGAAVVGLTRTLWSMREELPAHTAEDLARAFAAAVSAALGATAFDAGEPRSETTRAVVLQYLRDHLADPSLSVRSVSRALALSPRRLHALFEGADETFAAALRGMRMRRAVELLADPRPSVAAVGEAVGYPDPASFSRAFRGVFDAPPSAFRGPAHELHTARARNA